ncbi:MAG: DUF2997 domain-containing protein [Phycisphaerae bacterium]|nr:DUF2997 domain-containing protein [Phycisphaerae bacterium]
MKKIKITLHKDGTQKVEVFGAEGPEDCLEFTRQLEKRLGKPIGERVHKCDYGPVEHETERQREVE